MLSRTIFSKSNFLTQAFEYIKKHVGSDRPYLVILSHPNTDIRREFRVMTSIFPDDAVGPKKDYSKPIYISFEE